MNDKNKELEELKKKMAQMNEEQIRMADQLRRLENESIQMSKNSESSGPQLINL